MIKAGGDLLTLEQFLSYPEVCPALEYFGGRVVQKMSPTRPHGLIQMTLGADLLQFVRSKKLGMMYTELRCSFGGISYVPDLCFIAKGRIPRNQKGELVSKIRFAPDFAVEILSPGQTVGELTAKLRFAIKNGLRLGWLIHARKRQIYILQEERKTEILRLGDFLDGQQVLPGYRLSTEELFSWEAED